MDIFLKTLVCLFFLESIYCYNPLQLVVLENKLVRAKCSPLTRDSVSFISDAPLVFNQSSAGTKPETVVSLGFSDVVILDKESNAEKLTIFSFLEAIRQQQYAKTIVNTFMEVLRYYSWTDFIILSDESHRFYVQTGQYLYKEALQNMLAVDYFQVNEKFDNKDILKIVSNQRKRIIFLSMPSRMIEKVLTVRKAHHMNWQEYAWVVHSIYKDFANHDLYNGLIELKAEVIISSASSPNDHYFNKSCMNLSYDVPKSVDLYLMYQERNTHVANYNEVSGFYHITPGLKVPQDSSIHSVPIVFNAIFSLGILICFVTVTTTLILYIRFRKEPGIKATSTSLTALIFIGCYSWIFYLCVLNFTLLPGYHKRPSYIRDAICLLRMWLNGLGYPVVLIMGITLVKMIRIYRIFYCRGKLNKYLSGNCALAVYALILTSPNALICLAWLFQDPFVSHLYFTTIGGHRYIMERCQSETAIQWLLGLLVHIIILALALLVAAIKTRNIMLADFKDSGQIRGFSLCFFLTTSAGLLYWYTLSTILSASAVLVHAALQIFHYCLIFQILAFLFMPKLYPILKYKWIKKFSVPTPKL